MSEAPRSKVEQSTEQTFLDIKSEAKNESNENKIQDILKGHETKLQEARQEVRVIEEDDPTTNKVLEKLDLYEESDSDLDNLPVSKEVRGDNLKAELKQIRTKLPKRDRAMSSFIHVPIIKKLSESTSKSISRPSGLLGGGLLAFLGTTIYYFYSKNQGIKYNFFVYFLLLVIGFVMGLLIEMLIRLIFIRKQID